VPSNRHHEFNVMAMAEWSWNAEGRSVAEFCRAYAGQTGICDPELFARWAAKTGDAGWWLAESRLLLKAIYDPAFILRPVVYDDHRFELSDLLYKRSQIEAALLTARQGLELAYESGVEDMVDESEALCAGLRALLAVDTARPLLAKPVLDAGARERLASALHEFDAAAAVLSTRVSRWGARVDQNLEPGSRLRAPSRLRDTAQVLCKVADRARARAAELGVPDEHPRHRLRPVGVWSAKDLGEGRAVLTFDVSRMTDGNPGAWFAGFDYEAGDYGALVRRVSLFVDAPEGRRQVAEAYDGELYVGRWERWHEAKLVVPTVDADAKLWLEVEVEAQVLGTVHLGGKAWECSGRVGLRRGWPDDVAYVPG
jgi:hypothetical protein